MRNVVVLAALLAVTLTAVTASLGATTLRISAAKGTKLAFSVKALKARAGKVTIVMANPSALPHNVGIKASTWAGSKVIAQGNLVGKGGTSKVTAKLRKGKYRFFCWVPGHEDGGMWGILTVR